MPCSDAQLCFLLPTRNGRTPIPTLRTRLPMCGFSYLFFFAPPVRLCLALTHSFFFFFVFLLVLLCSTRLLVPCSIAQLCNFSLFSRSTRLLVPFQVQEIKKDGFTAVWLPPPSDAVSEQVGACTCMSVICVCVCVCVCVCANICSVWLPPPSDAVSEQVGTCTCMCALCCVCVCVTMQAR